MMLTKGMKLRAKGFNDFNEKLLIKEPDFPAKLLISDGEVLKVIGQKSFSHNDWIVERENGKEQIIGGTLLQNCEIINGLPEDLFNV